VRERGGRGARLPVKLSGRVGRTDAVMGMKGGVVVSSYVVFFDHLCLVVEKI
jgi:hypothetical protein